MRYRLQCSNAAIIVLAVMACSPERGNGRLPSGPSFSGAVSGDNCALGGDFDEPPYFLGFFADPCYLADDGFQGEEIRFGFEAAPAALFNPTVVYFVHEVQRTGGGAGYRLASARLNPNNGVVASSPQLRLDPVLAASGFQAYAGGCDEDITDPDICADEAFRQISGGNRHDEARLCIWNESSGVSAQICVDALNPGGVVTNQLPKAQFTVSQVYADADSAVLFFDAGPSSDLENDALDYTWSFPNDVVITDSAFQLAFTSSGTYLFTLRAAEASGVFGLKRGVVAVSLEEQNDPPSASFSYNCSGLTLGCTFNNTSTDSDGTITSYLWDFGDGVQGTETSPVHAYASPGPRTVILTIGDNDGGTDADTIEVAPFAVAIEGVNIDYTTDYQHLAPDQASCTWTATVDEGSLDGATYSYSWTWKYPTQRGSGSSFVHSVGTNTTILTLVVQRSGRPESASAGVKVFTDGVATCN